MLAHHSRRASVQSEGKDSDAVVLGCWPPFAGSQQYNRQAQPRLPLPRGMTARLSPSQFPDSSDKGVGPARRLGLVQQLRQLRHVGRNPPRLIFGEQLITLVMDVGECLAAMVAQQLRALC
jgi:hypothetical protein